MIVAVKKMFSICKFISEMDCRMMKERGYTLSNYVFKNSVYNLQTKNWMI